MPEMTQTQLQDAISKAVEAAVSKHVEPISKALDELGKARQASSVTSLVRGDAIREDGGREAGFATGVSRRDGSEDTKPGLNVARWLRCIAGAKYVTGQGEPISPAQYAARVYGESHPVSQALARAGQFHVRTLTAQGEPSLVPVEFSTDLIEFLRPMSVVETMKPRRVPMPTGKMSIPRITTGATAAYSGEVSNIAPSQMKTGPLELFAKKLTTITPASMDLIRHASIQADTAIRDDLVRAMAQKRDAALIRNDGTAFGPKGLRYWPPSASVIAANGTVSLANVTVDLGKLRLALRNANVHFTRPGWLMAPNAENYLLNVQTSTGQYAYRPEMLTGNLWRYPYAVTTAIPQNLGGGSNASEVYLVDFDEFVVGETMNLLLDASTEAAYYDGSAVQAAFSQDTIVFRAIEEHDCGMRHDLAVAVLTGVLWT